MLQRLLFVFIFSVTGHAESFVAFGKTAPLVNYADRGMCESQEGQTCYDVSSCPADECTPILIDDLSKPKYLRRNVQACVASDCKTDLAALTCDQGFGVIAADLVTVYCAVPNGYEQKTGDTLARDEAKTVAKALAQEKINAREALVREGMRRQEIGARIIALISANNQSKSLTNEQAVQLTQTLAPIIGQLQTGSIPSAKSLVQKLTPGGVVTQADIDLALGQFTAEGF
jgi:hypothetical protein